MVMILSLNMYYSRWSGTPEVVTVVPIGDVGKTCTEKASVTAVWQSSLRRTSTIYARDIGKRFSLFKYQANFQLRVMSSNVM